MCTTGSAVWPAICTMQPILPAATSAAPVLSIAAALRAPSAPARSGWSILYVPAEPQQKCPSGTVRTVKPAAARSAIGWRSIFWPCWSEQAE